MTIDIVFMREKGPFPHMCYTNYKIWIENWGSLYMGKYLSQYDNLDFVIIYAGLNDIFRQICQ